MPFEQGHALLIGVSSHKYAPQLDLPIVAADAKAVAEVLLNPDLCGYPPNQVQVLQAEFASRAGILAALDGLAQRVSADDRVLIFFCGQGEYGTDGDYYLIGHDAKLQGDKVASGTAVSQRDLIEKIKNIPAERVLLIFNTPASGEISPTLDVDQALGAKGLPNTAAEALLSTGSGRIVFTACRAGQFSYISDGPLTLFTQALVDGLKGQGLLPRGGAIGAFDLYAALYEKVSQAAQVRHQKPQEPELAVLKGGRSFAVTLYQGASDADLRLAEASTELPAGAAARAVSPKRSQRLYQQFIQQSGGVNFGAGNLIQAGRDVIGEQHIDTAGGTYVGGNLISGDFRGAVIHIESATVGAAEAQDIEDLPPEPGGPPFQGLQYFDEKDSERFFGRELLTARVIWRLQRATFLAVIGASGSGKSSLVRAGVIPALRRGQRLADGGLPPTDSGQWAIKVITPSAHPLEALAAALASEAEPVSAITTLSNELAQDPRTLLLAARKFLAGQGGKHLLLFIDQFEEVFTLCRRPEEREAFVANLLEAAAEPEGSPITVLIALRADYYAQVAQHDRLREIVSQNQEFIGAMSREELVRAIDQPLAQGNWKIQEGLIEVILDDIGYEPGALPLLSHALHETWLHRRGRTLTLSGYNEAGGVRGAIAQTAESVFRQLPPQQQPVARMIFLRMAELGEDSHDTRRRATYTELITRATDEVVIEAVIKILADARLVTTDTLQPGDTKVVEVAHEALIREWPTLREWLDEDREGLILHQHLTDDTNDWVKLGRDPGSLYRGARLEAAQAWAVKNPEALSLLEQDFLEASQHVARQEAIQAIQLARASRLQRIYIAVTAVLLVALAYLAYTFLIHKEPAVMNRFYNIAVAAFGADATAGGEPQAGLGDALYTSLEGELGENPNLLVWHDSPELRKLNVKIGAVSGSSPEARGQAAADMASRLHADMVIYASSTPDQGNVNLEFYLAPQLDYDYQDIQGSFGLGCPVPVESPADSEALKAQLAPCANALAWTAVGLSEAQLGHSLEALEAFLKAGQFYSQSEVIQFLIGREYLFLVDRESVLQFAQDAFEKQAEQAFKASIALNQDYARAYIGLGGVYFKRAQRLLGEIQSESPANSQDQAALSEAMQITDQAIGAFNQALGLGASSGNYGIPVESVAQLGLGNSYRLKGEILQRQGQSGQAMDQFDQSIETLQRTVEPLQQADQARYLTQAYEYLGTAYQWQAYAYILVQNYESGLAAYDRALEYYDKCIAQGESTQDLIIKNDIVGGICRPSKESVKETLDGLRGVQG